MEIILSIFGALIAWRFLLALVIAIIIGFPLGHLFGSAIGFFIVLTGIGFGFIWQGRWLSGIPFFASTPSPSISKPVAFLGLSFIGALWGGFTSDIFDSALAGGAALIASVALIGGWLTLVLKRHVQLNNLAFAAFSLLCGLGGLYAVSVLHAKEPSSSLLYGLPPQEFDRLEKRLVIAQQHLTGWLGM